MAFKGGSLGRGTFVPLCEQQEDDEATESQPTQEKVIASTVDHAQLLDYTQVIGLINQAQLEHKSEKLECLRQVKELIINKDPNLLDSFLDEVIAFQQDQSPDVRKFVVEFMEDACKKDQGLLVRVIPMLSYMLEDSNTTVIKRVMTAFMQLYMMAFLHTVKFKGSLEDLKEMWETLQETKLWALDVLESENDGIRTMAIKFMEIIILAQTKKELNSEPPKASEFDVSLDVIPSSHKLLNVAELQEEAGRSIGSLLSLTASPTLSSVSLMACISCLTNIARQRPSNMSTVVQTFELLHANLPPHFAASQVSSVTKQLKSQVLSLLRHPSSFDCREQISTLLTDLGCTQADIVRSTPKLEKLKRPRNDDESYLLTKKQKLSDVHVDAVAPGNETGESTEHKLITRPVYSNMEAIEMTATDLKPLLTSEIVTELVMTNIDNLPRKMPKTFYNSYTPIARAGTEAQVSHLARLLASQMITAGIGIGAQIKNVQPQLQEIDTLPHKTGLVVSDPRQRSKEVLVQSNQEKSAEPDTQGPSVEKLAESMTELALLGSLLGLPSIFDPMFPATYASFFGSYPPWMEETQYAITTKTEKQETDDTKPTPVVASANLVTILTSPTSENEKDKKEKSKKERKPHVAPPQRLKRIRVFDLSSAVEPLNENQQSSITVNAFKRILSTETNDGAYFQSGEIQSLVTRECHSICPLAKYPCIHEEMTNQHGIGQVRIALIINLVSQFGGSYDKVLLDFILEELRMNFDLAIAWLYAQYNLSEGYHHSAKNTFSYDMCLKGILIGACEKLDPRDRLFTRLVLEAPKITSSALEVIKSYCRNEDHAFLGVTTLKELILKRPHGPNGSDDFLHALLEATISTLELARVQALHVAKKFYGKDELASKIERFALQSLQYLLADYPPFHQDIGDMEVASEWTEETVSLCLGLFVALLPMNHKLLKDLAMIYTATTPMVKSFILRHIDKPVRTIGMDSSELLLLVESCPPGGETLIMRMLYILTENAIPSVELVKRVREMYNRNPSDVRFLIPVLHGLQKTEIILALPKFLTLSPKLVKSVFDRLLISYKGDHGHSISPVTPSELLIALHHIDCSNDQMLMKAVIKGTNICFADKAIYTQEVLAVVLQQLLDEIPIPVLFMRSVIQSLSIYPKLINFVMTILTKLISKQVWKQPTVWQGFVKCCELTKPRSLQVLLQLPQKQLDTVLEAHPKMKEALIGHIRSLAPQQQALISLTLLQSLDLTSNVANSSKKKRKDLSHKKKRHSSKDSELNK